MQIIKLNNKRDNFTNISYNNNFLEKEIHYKNTITRIINAFNTVEYLNVVENVRDAHLTFIKPEDVENKTKFFSKYGLSIVLLDKEADTSGNYGNHSLPYVEGQRFTWRSIITKPEFVNDWKDIWNVRETDVLKCEHLIGRALGYPDCCAKQFTEIWMKRGGIDTTWQQAACTVTNTSNYVDAERLMLDYNAICLPDNTEMWSSNLLRWAGLKLVSHLPCSFNCKESKKIALQNIAVATKNGFGDEYHKLCRMLDWEISWTAEFGVATIETPVFNIITATDITTVPYKVVKKGHNNCIL